LRPPLFSETGFSGGAARKAKQENYPVAIPPRNPKVTMMGIRATLGFPSLPIAGLKRHRRTADKTLSVKPLSRPLTTSICCALPCSVTVARRPSASSPRFVAVGDGNVSNLVSCVSFCSQHHDWLLLCFPRPQNALCYGQNLPQALVPRDRNGQRLIATICETVRGLEAAEQEKQERARTAARAQYLDELAGPEAQIWEQVGALVEKKQPTKYDRALRHVLSLRDLAARRGQQVHFDSALERLRMNHRAKPTFPRRLSDAVL